LIKSQNNELHQAFGDFKQTIDWWFGKQYDKAKFIQKKILSLELIIEDMLKPFVRKLKPRQNKIDF
jgi:hypothetical protein